MHTDPHRFQDYDQLGQVLGQLLDVATTREQKTRLLATPIELPDGRRITVRDLTAIHLAAVSDYMHAHVRNTAVAADSLN